MPMKTDLYLVNYVDYAIGCGKVAVDDGGISNTDALGGKKKCKSLFNSCSNMQTYWPGLKPQDLHGRVL